MIVDDEENMFKIRKIGKKQKDDTAAKTTSVAHQNSFDEFAKSIIVFNSSSTKKKKQK